MFDIFGRLLFGAYGQTVQNPTRPDRLSVERHVRRRRSAGGKRSVNIHFRKLRRVYGLQGRFDAQPGKGDELAAILLEAAEGLGTHDDCLLYVIGRLPDEPEAVLVYEVWTSSEAHRASLDLDETKAAIARGRPLIAGMSGRVEFEPAGGKGVRPA
jgi:quinol monooxygenase YgiN